MPIDYVVTFVDGNDTNWRRLYIKTFGRTPEVQRYRNYDTLKYALRGVAECMPWIGHIFLIVQSASQIPKWLDVSNPKIRIVYHEDFIPKEFLPTFNSNVIEMFIHKILGLSNEFILANDDMIPVKPMSEVRFFRDGKIVDNAVIKDSNIAKPNSTAIFDYILYNTTKLAARAANKQKVISYKDWHLLIPHLKEKWEYIWGRYANDIKIGLLNSQRRSRRNHNHWLFRYFTLNTGDYINDADMNTEGYLRLLDTTSKEEIQHKVQISDIVCFNDAINKNTRPFSFVKEVLEDRFPSKSEFEKGGTDLQDVTKNGRKIRILCIDRPIEENNSFGLFRYLLENHTDKVEVCYLTDVNDILKKYPRNAFSYSHKRDEVLRWCDVICFSFNIPFVAKVSKFEKVKIFVQHGITWAKSDNYIRKILDASSYATCTTEQELDYFNNFHTKCKNVLTGMAIYDYDKQESVKEKRITIMFTFRSDHEMPWISSFLNSPILKRISSELGYTIHYFTHHCSKTKARVPEYIQNEDITNLGTILKKSTAVITDFSSIAFKAAYLDKSLYCYQPDYEKYCSDRIKPKGWYDWKNNCLGFRSEKETEILNHLFSELTGVLPRHCDKSVFKYTDENNCKRICTEILKLE